MESDCCSLARVDFLGAMGVDLWSRSSKIVRKTRGEAEGEGKKMLEGKTISRKSIYRAQSIRSFAAAKGSSQWQIVST